MTMICDDPSPGNLRYPHFERQEDSSLKPPLCNHKGCSVLIYMRRQPVVRQRDERVQQQIDFPAMQCLPESSRRACRFSCRLQWVAELEKLTWFGG